MITNKAKNMNLSGQKFGRLTVMQKLDSVNRRGRYLCVCECGAQRTLTTSAITTGNTKSCGCLNTETRSKSNRKHGMRYTALYRVWLNMRQRCSNPKVDCYPRYGGRGITVCPQWSTFDHFFKDVSPTYVEGYELDRIDGDKGYYPENVQWLPHSENGRKRSYCKLNPEKAKLIRQSPSSHAELAEQYNVSKGTIIKVRANKIWTCAL